MELKLRGKSAAITGASKGIGLAIAEELAKEGVNLRLASRNDAELQRVADDLASRFHVTAETKRSTFPSAMCGTHLRINAGR